MRPFKASGTRELPGVDDGADKQRAALERKYAALLDDAFAALSAKLLPSNKTVTVAAVLARHKQHLGPVRDIVFQMLYEAATLGVTIGRAQIEAAQGVAAKPAPGSTTDWSLANLDVLHWLNGPESGARVGQGYGHGLMSLLATHNEEVIRASVAAWVTDGTPLSVLAAQLDNVLFDSARATTIAMTEVTRGYAEGNRAAWRAAGVVEQMRWRASNDELVCSICGGLDGHVIEIGSDAFTLDGADYFPPAHPRCRCWVVPVVRPV